MEDKVNTKMTAEVEYSYRFHSRLILITWAYIKLILMLLSMIPLYVLLIVNALFGIGYDFLLSWSTLLYYPLGFAFAIVLIVALHTKNLQLLKICFRYLIYETLILGILAGWVLKTVACNNDTVPWTVTALVIIAIIAQGICSAILTKAVINKQIKENYVPDLESDYKEDSKEEKEALP